MEWISIKDRLPDVGTKFLVTDGKEICLHGSGETSKKEYYIDCLKEFDTCFLEKSEHQWPDYWHCLTHWLRLTELPKENDNVES